MINYNQNSEDFEDNLDIPDFSKITNRILDISSIDSMNCSLNIEHNQLFNRFEKDKLQIDNNDWLTEKPISILQLDSADRAVLKIAGMKI